MKRQFLNIPTLKELELSLELQGDFLVNIQDNIFYCYKKFPQIDKKGKKRIFYVANNDLKKIHKKINKLLDELDYPSNIQGGITGRSIITNALVHVDKKYVANYDIKNFFPSVNYKMVFTAFRRMNCGYDVSKMLTRFTIVDGYLPQGFSTSPKISALVLYKLNYRIENLLKPFGLCHTFWVDDLTISGNCPIKKFHKIIYKIFEEEGFYLHDSPEKMKINDSKRRQTCTGLIVNKGLNPEHNLRENVWKELFLCRKFGVNNFLKKHNLPLAKDKYLEKLAGNISYLLSVNRKNIIFKEQFNLIK